MGWKSYIDLIKQKYLKGQLSKGQCAQIVVTHLITCEMAFGKFFCTCKHSTKMSINDKHGDWVTVCDVIHVVGNKVITAEKDGTRSIYLFSSNL